MTPTTSYIHICLRNHIHEMIQTIKNKIYITVKIRIYHNYYESVLKMRLHLTAILELRVIDHHVVRRAVPKLRRDTQIVHQAHHVRIERAHEHRTMPQHVDIRHHLPRVASRTKIVLVIHIVIAIFIHEICLIVARIPVPFFFQNVFPIAVETSAKKQKCIQC